jgi:predicted DNA-binding ribbon-helix-helix protein
MFGSYCPAWIRAGCRIGRTQSGASMKSAIVKRSVVLGGHKTSVSLENEFWEGLHQIAAAQKSTLTVLLEQIDAERRYTNLSSAIRIFVFEHYRAKAESASPSPDRNADSATL